MSSVLCARARAYKVHRACQRYPFESFRDSDARKRSAIADSTANPRENDIPVAANTLGASFLAEERRLKTATLLPVLSPRFLFHSRSGSIPANRSLARFLESVQTLIAREILRARLRGISTTFPDSRMRVAASPAPLFIPHRGGRWAGDRATRHA